MNYTRGENGKLLWLQPGGPAHACQNEGTSRTEEGKRQREECRSPAAAGMPSEPGQGERE